MMVFTLPVLSEELAWGDAGITLAIMGTTLGVSGIVGSGTPEQIAEWVPECFGTPDDLHVAAFAVSEPGRPLRLHLNIGPDL